MDRESIMNDEYEAQYYDAFNTTFFIKSLKATTIYAIEEVITIIEEKLKKCVSDPCILSNISKKNQEWKLKYIEAINVPLNDFKPIIRNFLKIPWNIVLNDAYNENIDILSLKKEESELEQNLFQQRAYNSVLNNEILCIERLESTKKLMEASFNRIEATDKRINEQKQFLKTLSTESKTSKEAKRTVKAGKYKSMPVTLL